MKVLFISEYLQIDVLCGAKTAALLHYRILCDLVGKENVDALAIYGRDRVEKTEDCIFLRAYRTRAGALCNLLRGDYIYVSLRIRNRIKRLCRARRYDAVFLDNRIFGGLIPLIRRELPAIRVITNFHGLSAYQFAKAQKKSRGIRHRLKKRPELRAEKAAVFGSDVLCLLHAREYERLKAYYGERPHCFLPCVMADAFDPTDTACAMRREEYNLLFVGGYYAPNNDGIAWFVKTVMPELDPAVRLYVVGYGIDRVPEEYHLPPMENVHFIGAAERLNPWYQCANLVIAPIFSGDGMKTKTAEALMFGKKILGTEEALSGYTDIVAEHCNTKEEFIAAIRRDFAEGRERCCAQNRKRYAEEFSIEAIRRTIAKCLSGTGGSKE